MEVGVASGKLTKRLAELKNLKKLILVDIDFSRFIHYEYKCELQKLNGWTTDILPSIKEKVDLIYLDAAHDFDSVSRDLASLAHLLVPHTIIIFNDFAITDRNFGTYGVHSAASTFCNENNVKVLGMALEKNGLYDLAVQILEKSENSSAL